MLEIKDFSLIYPNGTVGAKNVNLTIESGDIFAFIGHNGAGKTTTIKSIVGINNFTSGDILIDGVSIKKEPQKAKKLIAYVPDNPEVYKSLTGLQFINFIGEIYEIKKQDLIDRTTEYATKLGLIDNLNDPISTYSHGMCQKLVIISALIHSPKLLVLDEPFVGLDPLATYTLKTIMQEFVKNGGAIFFSTHVLEVAEKLCNKVAIIKNGQVIKNGTMAEIKQDKSLENVFLESAEWEN